MPCAATRAFTLVELLVVIAIIGILVSLLLPAVQSARESSRRIQCSNNLRQVALGCLAHHQAKGYLPPAGWGWGWAGDPTRGIGLAQPGGWQFNLLPHLEQQAIYDLTITSSPPALRQTVPMYRCPSRSSGQALPFVHSSPYRNVPNSLNPTPALIGRSDFAGNGGENQCDGGWRGPNTLAEGDALSDADWLKGCLAADVNGVFFRHMLITLAHVRDGASNTYLAGEKYINPDNYENGTSQGHDQGWNAGYDYDNCRWTDFSTGNEYNPRQDQAGYETFRKFGGPHPGVFLMALCDGSVHPIKLTVDKTMHDRLGNRKDGQPIDADSF